MNWANSFMDCFDEWHQNDKPIVAYTKSAVALCPFYLTLNAEIAINILKSPFIAVALLVKKMGN
jgi:hypothetical protein